MNLPPVSPAVPPRLVLGSTSAYRRELLHRLGMPFEVRSPGVDETARAGEAPSALAERLALAKARAVAAALPDSDVVVIGSDQVADLRGHALGKPGDHTGATAQLRAMRGQTVHFHTALTVCRPRTDYERTVVETVSVDFRDLSDAEIEAYLQREQPYDCAGSAKVEALGITLLSRVASNDPTTLIGLPLIALCQLLREAGLDPLANA
ncbi:Maf family nucleotide pyrophosphatase [uncultured Aquabacterium sp.]|uniref:Maf family nucleotide pyrophosphatase n=1 Tax=uncultured Aquabacterium sp. TaxID=158753 RepID=UPI002612DF06|nr:Maf family nucleotide pyrophosphatase [uncultured Aquabacterium sp.]